MTIVVVGAGLAGVSVAQALREHPYRGRILLVGEEHRLPYERPPLSKDVLDGRCTEADCAVLGEAELRRLDIDLRLGTRATGIDREHRRLELSDGGWLGYDTLVLATGLRPRPLVGMALGERIHSLRSMDDALRLKRALRPHAHLLVVGGGFLGLEVAATARGLGCEVTVVERHPAVLYRSVAPVVGDHVAALHLRHGVRVITDATPTALTPGASGEQRTQVVLSSGERLVADAVLAATGSLINTELAEAAGLEVDDGVVVDQYGRTSDPHIFAAGDITRHFNPLLGRAIRLESWQNARRQATVVAHAINGGTEPYAEVPWFWTDQYDMNLQISGYPAQWDRAVVHGSAAERRFTALYLDGDRVVGANLVNNGRHARLMAEWIAQRARIDLARLAANAPLEALRLPQGQPACALPSS